MIWSVRRNAKKLIILIAFGALTFLILVKSRGVDDQRISYSRNSDFERQMREAAIENDVRRQQVRRVCKKYKLGPFKSSSFENEFKEPPTPQYSVFYIDRKHNISYCPIYKSGSTTWIYNLCLLNGISENELSSGKEQISVIARRVMPEFDYPEAEKLLNKTIKMLIVRHPFERLLSAYRDKLENSVAGREHGSLHFYKRYGSSIVRKYRDDTRPSPRIDQVIRRPNQPAPAGIEPSWREFVEYLIHTELASYADDHWTPYHLYCTPCQLDYELIAKVETLSRDQAFAIRRLGIEGKIQPRWRHSTHDRESSDIDPATIYFSQISKEHVRKLYDKFRLDFELFGYSAERYYELATSID